MLTTSTYLEDPVTSQRITTQRRLTGIRSTVPWNPTPLVFTRSPTLNVICSPW